MVCGVYSQTTPIACSDVIASQLTCDFNCSCRLGALSTANCHSLVNCTGSNNFTKTFVCRYCFQVQEDLHICSPNTSCYSTDHDQYVSSCSIPTDMLCLGNRTFQKVMQCNFGSGYSWSTSVLLSIFLGGFGADRFYLGYVGWGIFKLLSFGGLGVWTIIDATLIWIGYLTPADGSLYLDLT